MIASRRHIVIFSNPQMREILSKFLKMPPQYEKKKSYLNSAMKDTFKLSPKRSRAGYRFPFNVYPCEQERLLKAFFFLKLRCIFRTPLFKHALDVRSKRLLPGTAVLQRLTGISCINIHTYTH